MNQRRQDLTTKTFRPFFGLVSLYFILGMSLPFLNSCKNDIEQINAINSELNLPNQSGENIEVQYTDSARLQLIFKAPSMKRFLHKEGGPYYEFPKGIHVVFYDSKEMPESEVTANYAIYYEEKQLWEARDSVVAVNLKSFEQLHTEQLYWDMNKKEIYSVVFTKISTADGVFYGDKGFESNQDFSKYKLKGSGGTVNVKDEEIK
jgi:LPS export ABC transporter protein LptC